jgi:beta-glucosidase
VVGEKAYAEALGDRPLPRLDADQMALISALEATGKPVIVVVMVGRPLGLGPGENANALLMAWQGGTRDRRRRGRRPVRQGQPGRPAAGHVAS